MRCSVFQPQITSSFDELMALGRVDPDNENEPFCMTVLALKTSRAANAVSELHGKVSRKMWQVLYPGKSVDEVPIGHITNGIHLMGWMKGPVRSFWRNKLGPALGQRHLLCRFLGTNAGSGICHGRGTLGAAIPASACPDRICPPASAHASYIVRRCQLLRPSARSGRPHHRFCDGVSPPTNALLSCLKIMMPS